MTWTEKENKFIKDNFNKMTLMQMLKFLPPDCKYGNLRSHTKNTMKLKKTSKSFPHKNYHNFEYFKKPNLINSWLAGAISADGSIMKFGNRYHFGYAVSSKDEEIIDIIKKELEFTGKKNYYKSKEKYVNKHKIKESEVVGIRITSFDKNAEYLKKHYNLTPNKTFRLGPTNIGNIYLNWAFIRGNIDGDGTIAMNKNKQTGYNIAYLHFCSASPHIIKWIKNLMDEYFPIQKYNYHGRNSEVLVGNLKTYYRYQIMGLRAAVIINFLSQIPTPGLFRKWYNPEVLEYINKQKLKYPHLFISPDPHELSKLLPPNNLQ